MSKKDRVGIVFTLLYVLAVWVLSYVVGYKFIAGVVFSTPLAIYWGYRFIQNDIGFLRMKE